ncbi:hypothetical protein NDU88_004059, partial [Pleurodeles waltl]
RFLSRGYPLKSLMDAQHRVKNKSRDELLFNNTAINSEFKQSPPRIFFQYNQQHDSLRTILQKNWHILQNDPIIRDDIGAHPSITFRKARSLGDYLTRSYFSMKVNTSWLSQKSLGFWKCGHCK